jgi:hypothetical protein
MPKEKIVDAIRAHFRRPERVKLTDEQKELWKRIDHAWALLTDTKKLRTDVEKVDILKYKHQITTRMGYEYLSWAKDLYGDILEGNKTAQRAIVYGYAQETLKLAMITKNASAMNGAVANMIKILGLDQPESEAPDFSNIQPPTVVLGLPKETQEGLLKLVNAGVVDLTGAEMRVKDAEFIDITPANPG